MTVANLSALLAEGPRQLLERPIPEYGALLREAEEVDEEHLLKVDYALRHTVVRLLVRAAAEDELAEVADETRRLLSVELEERLPNWSARWLGFSDLVAARLASVSARDSGRARSLLHAEEILAYVHDHPGQSQAAICDALGLGAANLSRILGVLEAHELIERWGVGREKHVYTGRLYEERLQEDSAGGIAVVATAAEGGPTEGMAAALSPEGAERMAAAAAA